jgi:hypothetical protein
VYTVVLLVERGLSAEDAAAIVALREGADEPSRYVVLVPAQARHNRLVEALDELALGDVRGLAHGEAATAAHAAGAWLDSTVGLLVAAGVAASGRVIGEDPIGELADTVADETADEVVVVTDPHLVEESVGRDWASRARHELRVPVLHVLANTGGRVA